MNLDEHIKKLHEGAERKDKERTERQKEDFKRMREEILKRDERTRRLLEKAQEKREREKKEELEEKVQKELKEAEKAIRADFDRKNGLHWADEEKRNKDLEQLTALRKNRNKK